MGSARSIHAVIFDGFADWEPAHALAELRRWGKRTVRTVGFTSAPNAGDEALWYAMFKEGRLPEPSSSNDC